jgi:membrane protease YdiL (CAAX protease family)
VPGDFAKESIEMLTAGGIVAAFAVPVGLVAWRIARSRREAFLPAWKPWRVPWGGFEVLAAFVMIAVVVPSILAMTNILRVAVGVAALPIQLMLLLLASKLLFPQRSRVASLPPLSVARTGYAGLVAIAVLLWAVLTPPILIFHAGVLEIFTALNWKPDEHPAAKFVSDTSLAQFLFLLSVCVAAPLMEEILFRGVLLPWAIGGRERDAGPLNAPPLAPPAFRPWFVMGFAVLLSATRGSVGPIVFAGVLTVGLAVVWTTVWRGKRHVRGVYASAALFAMVHSAVWPSPIPLFLLGLGLGWCAVRTRGVLVPAMVHGLFNAVSAVYVLRGGAG